MISLPACLCLFVSLKQNAEEEPGSYLSMSVEKGEHMDRLWFILVLTQLEATTLKVNYSY